MLVERLRAGKLDKIWLFKNSGGQKNLTGFENGEIMQKYISMLRGINVSGQKKIKMDALRTLYAALHFKNVKSYIQSGNVIFESDELDTSRLAKQIGAQIEQTFGFLVPIMIRTPEQFQNLLENNPFLGEKTEDIRQLYVTFLDEASPIGALDALVKFATKSEEFHLRGKEIYLFYPNGAGRSKLSNNLIERKLGVTATTRNWRTVSKLADLSK